MRVVICQTDGVIRPDGQNEYLKRFEYNAAHFVLNTNTDEYELCCYPEIKTGIQALYVQAREIKRQYWNFTPVAWMLFTVLITLILVAMFM